jgi:nucleoside-diphosphate-sugar epimerase
MEIDVKVFVTGATGWVGSAVVSELLKAGHDVTGLTTSAKGAKKLEGLGVNAVVGQLSDLSVLREAAKQADGVIHTAFIHDLAHMSMATRFRLFTGALNGGIVSSFMRILLETEENAIKALGSGLGSNGGSLVVTSGTVNLPQGVVATEQSKHIAVPNRAFSEIAAFDFIQKGVRASAIRLAPTVHGAGDQGFVPSIIKSAQKAGASAYVGEGTNRWASIHRLDAARLFRLALENSRPGAVYHGAAESGISFKEIAAIIGRKLQLPLISVEGKRAAKHFGMIAAFVGLDNPASSDWTREELGWVPENVGLLEDMDDNYFQSSGRQAY